MSEHGSPADNTPTPAEHPGVPAWVKLLGLAAIVVVLAVALLMLLGIGGEHGPGRHG